MERVSGLHPAVYIAAGLGATFSLQHASGVVGGVLLAVAGGKMWFSKLQVPKRPAVKKTKPEWATDASVLEKPVKKPEVPARSYYNDHGH
jgi:hypothetical protein